MNINDSKYWNEQFQTELSGDYDRWCFERFEYISAYIDADAKVLDVGCGLGQLLRYIKAKYPKTITVGVDISETAIENSKGIYPGILFKLWDGNKLPFKDGEFDTVIATEVIEHLDEDKVKPFIEELKRVTSEKGNVIITTPYRGMMEGEPGKEGSTMSEEHIKEYTPEELQDIINPVPGKISLAIPPVKQTLEGKQIFSPYFLFSFHPHTSIIFPTRRLMYG